MIIKAATGRVGALQGILVTYELLIMVKGDKLWAAYSMPVKISVKALAAGGSPRYKGPLRAIFLPTRFCNMNPILLFVLSLFLWHSFMILAAPTDQDIVTVIETLRKTKTSCSCTETDRPTPTTSNDTLTVGISIGVGSSSSSVNTDSAHSAGTLITVTKSMAYPVTVDNTVYKTQTSTDMRYSGQLTTVEVTKNPTETLTYAITHSVAKTITEQHSTAGQVSANEHVNLGFEKVTAGRDDTTISEIHIPVPVTVFPSPLDLKPGYRAGPPDSVPMESYGITTDTSSSVDPTPSELLFISLERIRTYVPHIKHNICQFAHLEL
ncbi:hypothetical protein N7492_009780 [Penicillium capsulatum]|uniref:Uncharacterized protein n=1 Tax=Penicillium capsulatum TaxID=69766 RepID=A0A9W9HPU9_9EURO|nr:hypothetical protein N7492_009780 [Penicillium capsulatum]KAJ6114138.1 hypothetical protein N7512_007583 [Penicillium capsulatum]